MKTIFIFFSIFFTTESSYSLTKFEPIKLNDLPELLCPNKYRLRSTKEGTTYSKGEQLQYLCYNAKGETHPEYEFKATVTHHESGYYALTTAREKNIEKHFSYYPEGHLKQYKEKDLTTGATLVSCNYEYDSNFKAVSINSSSHTPRSQCRRVLDFMNAMAISILRGRPVDERIAEDLLPTLYQKSPCTTEASIQGCPGAEMSPNGNQITCVDGKRYILDNTSIYQIRQHIKKPDDQDSGDKESSEATIQ